MLGVIINKVLTTITNCEVELITSLFLALVLNIGNFGLAPLFPWFDNTLIVNEDDSSCFFKHFDKIKVTIEITVKPTIL